MDGHATLAMGSRRFQVLNSESDNARWFSTIFLRLDRVFVPAGTIMAPH